MHPQRCSLALLTVLLFTLATELHAQEAQRRWAMMAQIRRDKFDYVLPQAMRENNIDMWIVMNREGHNDPLWPDGADGAAFVQVPLNSFKYPFFF